MPGRSGFNIKEYLSQRGGNNVEHITIKETERSREEEQYVQIYEAVQQYFSTEKKAELNDCIKKNNVKLLGDITSAFVEKTFSKVMFDEKDLQEIVGRCVDDMIGYGLLTKFFGRSDEIEEININAWDAIEVKWTNGVDEILEETFQSAEQAENIILRILKQSGKFLDNNKVYEITYIGKSVRITTVRFPVVDEDVRIAASIRFIHSAVFTLDKMVETGFMLPEMGDALSSFMKHGISSIVCGPTGSGKTTVLNALLNTIDSQTRVITLEGGSREFELVRKDDEGKTINNRLHLQTRPHREDALNIDLQMLLDLVLKMDPDIVVVGEMVSEEAFIASETARTGHTVLSTIHANSAFDAYYRMFTLGIRKYELAENLMLKFMVDAFPIVCYCKKYPDGKRRMQSILEGHYVDGHIEFNELWHFEVEDNIIDEDGKIQTIGKFKKLHHIKNDLIDRMLDNGATRSDIAKLTDGDLEV